MEMSLLLLSIQGLMGAFDSLYHHEFKERLSLKPSAQFELKLHSIRSFLYSLFFITFAWIEWHGVYSLAFAALIAIELFITLWDFVEEDASRHLSPTERITHTLLTLNFGAVLAFFAPELLRWYQASSEVIFVDHGLYSWIMTAYAVGVIPSAIREYLSYRQLARVAKKTHPDSVTPAVRPHHVLITGATGFIGQHLCQTLSSKGHILTVLARDFDKVSALKLKRITMINSLDQLTDDDYFDAIFNLAGEPIVAGRWTTQRKQDIISSRVDMTQSLVNLIERMTVKPSVLVSGSAIGYYGPQTDQKIDENSLSVESFSYQLCEQWEAVASLAEAHNVRVCLIRTGLVLGRSGGMLAQMLMPFIYGLGGKLGHGQQWMSWVHIDDMINILQEAMLNVHLSGPINATAPQPVPNQEFTRALGKVLHRPTIFAVPASILRLLLGELADELFLSGQRVIPKKLLDHGFSFRYPTISSALKEIVIR